MQIEPHLLLKHIWYINTPKNLIFKLLTQGKTRDFTVCIMELIKQACQACQASLLVLRIEIHMLLNATTYYVNIGTWHYCLFG